MKLTGIKSTVSELKNKQYGRIYVNKSTGRVFAIYYSDQNSYTLFGSENIIEVCRYHYHFHCLSMKWVREQVENRLNDLGIC